MVKETINASCSCFVHHWRGKVVGLHWTEMLTANPRQVRYQYFHSWLNLTSIHGVHLSIDFASGGRVPAESLREVVKMDHSVMSCSSTVARTCVSALCYYWYFISNLWLKKRDYLSCNSIARCTKGGGIGYGGWAYSVRGEGMLAHGSVTDMNSCIVLYSL